MANTLRYEDFMDVLPMAKEYDRYIQGLCPFHEDSSPSLLVFRDGFWRCLGCNRSNTWIILWNKLKGQPVKVRRDRAIGWRGPNTTEYDSLESLCYQAHLDILQFSSYQWYMEQRGLEGRIEINEIGYHQGWYTIPVTDEDGKFITCVFRASPPVQQVSGERYWVSHAPVPFVPDWRRFKSEKRVFVVYGMLDALTLADLQLPAMTSTAGQGKFNPEWLDKIRRPIYIVPDLGEEKSAIDLAKNLGWRGNVVYLDYPKGVKDPNGFFEQGKRDPLYKQLIQYT
jgi:hypothetical protein